MQVQIADDGTLAKKVTIAYSREEVLARRQAVLRKLSSEVKLPGFRPGKSSLAVVEKRFGAVATQQVEEELANEGFSKAASEHKLKPIGPVRNQEAAREDGLRVTFAFEITPKIELPEPKSLSVPAGEGTVEDQEIDETLTSLARRGGSLVELGADQTIASDDSITLSGSLRAAGQELRAFHDLHHLVGGYPLLGKPPTEVVELLKDKKVGSQLAFSTTLPATFKPEEHAGKAVDVDFTVQKASRLQPATIDDEFAKRVGAADLAALKQTVRDNLKRNKDAQARQGQLDELMRQLLAQVKVDLPPKLFEGLFQSRLASALAEAADKPEAERDAAKAEAEKSARAGAEEALKRFLVLDALAERFAVKVTRQDLEGQIQMAASRSGQAPEQVAKRLVDSGRINDVVGEIRQAKALETMLDQVLGRETEPDQGEDIGHVHGPGCGHENEPGHLHGPDSEH